MTSGKHGFDWPELDGARVDRSSGHSRPQNIYDQPEFFEGYRALRQDDTGLNGSLEVPAMRALLPDLVGKDVLDLGCGFGDFARYARQQGARTVTALDVSERMIAEAKRLTGDDAIIFVCSAIEDFAGRPETFNLIVSSMALHYVQPFKAVVRRIFEALTPGGCFIFSVEHPICTANPKGWVRNPQGKALHWPVDRYQEEGERRTSWFVDGVVKFHRTTETYVDTLIDAGFRLRGLREPQAQPSFLDARPWLQETLRRPPVLMLAASRPPSPSL